MLTCYSQDTLFVHDETEKCPEAEQAAAMAEYRDELARGYRPWHEQHRDGREFLLEQHDDSEDKYYLEDAHGTYKSDAIVRLDKFWQSMVMK